MTTNTKKPFFVDECTGCTKRCIYCEHYDFVRLLNDPENYHYEDDGSLAWVGFLICVLAMLVTIAGIVLVVRMAM